MSTRHPDLERALERVHDGGTAGRWVVVVNEDAIMIRRRGDEDGYATAGRIAERLDELYSEPHDSVYVCESCGEEA